MFYIGFTSAPRVDEEGWRYASGGLELGNDADSFSADLTAWTIQDYEKQWREGVARLAAGRSSSALITSYAGPDAGFHSMWPMWKIGDQVVFHEHLVPNEVIAQSDVIGSFYAAVGERRTRSEDGEAISEWLVPFAEVLSYLATE